MSHSSSDFLSNLLILLLRLRNAGIDDAGLIALLSEATAGSLSGVGHSSAYEELGTYSYAKVSTTELSLTLTCSLAVRFLFEASGVLHGPAELQVDHFSPRAPRNDYEIPWALRHILADPRVGELFGQQFIELRTAFDDWQPKTTALKDLRRKVRLIMSLDLRCCLHVVPARTHSSTSRKPTVVSIGAPGGEECVHPNRHRIE